MMTQRTLNRVARHESLERRILLTSTGTAGESILMSRTVAVTAVEQEFDGTIDDGQLPGELTSPATVTFADVSIDLDYPLPPVIDSEGSGSEEMPGPPIRSYALDGWKWPDSRIPVGYYINTSNLPAGVNRSDYISAVDNTFQAWEDIPTTTIRFFRIGFGSQFGAGAADGVTTVGFGTAVSGALAHTTTYADGVGVTEFDVVLGDDRASWSANPGGPGGNQVDVWATNTHEVGHGLGLGHSSDTDASMYLAIFVGSTHQRDPNGDDIAGLEQLYPALSNQAPPIPNSMSVSNVLEDRATVSWSASIDPDRDPVSYELQIRRDDLSNNWNSILTSTTSRTITGLRSDTTYRVRVRATDGQSTSGWHQTVGLFTTLSSNQAPTIPGPLSATDVLSNQATITWGASTDPQGDPITYEVQFRKEDKSDSWSSSLTTSSPFRTIAGLQSDTTYRVRVQATNGQVASDWRKTNKLLTTLPSVPTLDIGEFGTLTNVTHVSQTVLLSRIYDNPVVLAQSASTNGQQAIVVRVTGIQSDRFSIYVAESSTGDVTHKAEKVSYVVLESGTHRLADGAKLEAGTVTTSATVGGKISNQWETVSLAEDFFSKKVLDATPVVFTQVQTDTGDAFLATRQNSITTTSFDVALEPEEASTTQHNSETVGYLAIEAGTHATGNVLLEANYTPTSVTQDWYPLAFGRQYSTPGLLSSLASYQGSDNAHVRFQHLTGGNVELKVGEDKSSDTETDHTAESVAYLAIGGSGMLSATVGQLEIGQFGVITDLTNAVQTIFLDRTFDSPVVFAQSPTANGGQPVVVRINNVLSDRFSIYLAEPSNEDGTHGAETVTYMVLEAGTHLLADGTRLEVGTRTTSANVGRQVNDQWEWVFFDSPFASTPVVLTQIQTVSGVPYLQTRQTGVVANRFLVALQPEEATATQQLPETIGYLAIAAGAGVWNGHVFEAGNTGAVVTDAATTVSFDRRFPGVPALLTSMNTYLGKDNAHVRYSNLSDEDVDLLIGEDTTADTELTHGSEDVAYLAIGGSGMLTATPAQLIIGEVGVITDLTNEAQTVLLNRSFVAPVVFAQSPTANGVQPAVVRIANVLSDRFSIFLAEPSNEDGMHKAETVTYMVLEAGVHELPDGTRLEVGTRTTGASVGRRVADQWKSVTFTSPFPSAPVVLSQIQTVSGASYLHTRQTGVGTTQVSLALQQEEAIATQHVPEIVGFLAIESGVGSWGGRMFEARRTSAVVSHESTTVGFSESFPTAPSLLTSLSTNSGRDNAHLRYGNLSADNVQLRVGEDTTFDTEIIHGMESVAFLAIEGVGLLTSKEPATPPVLASAIRDGASDTLFALAITVDPSANVDTESTGPTSPLTNAELVAIPLQEPLQPVEGLVVPVAALDDTGTDSSPRRPVFGPIHDAIDQALKDVSDWQ